MSTKELMIVILNYLPKKLEDNFAFKTFFEPLLLSLDKTNIIIKMSKIYFEYIKTKVPFFNGSDIIILDENSDKELEIAFQGLCCAKFTIIKENISLISSLDILYKDRFLSRLMKSTPNEEDCQNLYPSDYSVVRCKELDRTKDEITKDDKFYIHKCTFLSKDEFIDLLNKEICQKQASLFKSDHKNNVTMDYDPYEFALPMTLEEFSNDIYGQFEATNHEIKNPGFVESFKEQIYENLSSNKYIIIPSVFCKKCFTNATLGRQLNNKSLAILECDETYFLLIIYFMGNDYTYFLKALNYDQVMDILRKSQSNATNRLLMEYFGELGLEN